MKLCTFTHQGSTRVGVVEGEEVVDLAQAAAKLPREMVALLEAGADALAQAKQAAGKGGHRIPLGEVTLEAPVLRPPKILAVGLNYADHIAETGLDTPKVPIIFNKQRTSIHGPHAPFHMPRASDKLDYEGELAFVIGRRCRHVPKGRAAEVIAGYCVADDVSVRDWQMKAPTMTMGKSFDTHCPLGPWIVTGDEIGDPHGLELKTWVNGEQRQSSNTKNLIFGCFELIEHLTTAFTLEPGDVVLTGTPSGVAIGHKPPKWLHVGDVVKIAIDGIGEIENAVIAEPESTKQL